MITIGEKIKSLRKAKGKSQEDLALYIGVSRQTINKWETNKVQPNTDNIMMLCSVFEISSDYFLVQETKDLEIEVAASTDSTRNKRKVLIICAVVVGLIFLISTFICIVFGFVTFSSNVGDRVVKSNNIEITGFILTLTAAIITLIAEIVILIFILRNRQKSTKVDINVN